MLTLLALFTLLTSGCSQADKVTDDSAPPEGDADADSDSDSDSDADADADSDSDSDADPPEAKLVLNELVAGNETGATDEAGQNEDWIELLNIGDAAAIAAATLTRRATTIARGTARAARAAGTARAPRGALLSGAHVHTTTAEARAVHRLHRRLRVLIVFKGHEPEATGLAGLPIDDDRRLRDGPKGLERFTQLTLACGPREPADEQPVSHLLALLFQGGPFRANLITHSKP